VLLFVTTATGAPPDSAKWKLVLKVDGKEVVLPLLSAGPDVVPEEDRADTFSVSGVKVEISGRFDVNRDGTADGQDKLTLDAGGEVKPRSVLNKPVILNPTEKGDDTVADYIELPGLGRCAIQKGSTLTATKFRKLPGGHYVISGTIDLKLKGDKGQQKAVQGQFEAGTGEG
jgi:hypothetical protein